MRDWDLLEKVGPPKISNVQSAAVDVASKGSVAFPVFKAVPGSGQNDSHQVFGWKVVQDLQAKVAKFVINSSEVMQVISVINADVLAPKDIMHLATILFQPVQYSLFQNTWRQLAERKALENMQLPQQDPCSAVGVDALMGTGPFTNPDLRTQQFGMSALIKTMEMASPKQRYVTIQQGSTESFLQFVKKIAAVVEKQVDNENLRQNLCKQLTRDNANEDSQKLIESLPGDPSLVDIVTACSKVGTITHKMAVLAAVLKPSQICFICGETGHLMAQCPRSNEQTIKISCKWTETARKRKEKREGVPGDTNTPTLAMNHLGPATSSICEQYSAATRGSTGLDIPIADTVAILKKQICKVLLATYSPIGQGLSALLVGRSSSTIQGINVHLGVIDCDYLGQIYAMVSVSDPPVVIQKGTCIAQLISFVSCVPNVVDRSRGTEGFGSTGPPLVFWTQRVTDHCLEEWCIVTAKGHHPETIILTGLLDNGSRCDYHFTAFLTFILAPHSSRFWSRR
ncbi:hypothetical protein Nmel_012430, partial [Mimus melanotis]